MRLSDVMTQAFPLERSDELESRVIMWLSDPQKFFLDFSHLAEKSEMEKFSERERNLSTAEKTFRVFSRSATLNRCYILFQLRSSVKLRSKVNLESVNQKSEAVHEDIELRGFGVTLLQN